MESDWVGSYYEALEFFYWEPQHIGRKKHISAEFDTLDKVKRHFHRMEVTLNHNLNQFFLLAPSFLRNELFAELFHHPFSRPFAMWGNGVNIEFTLEDATQPDFLFTSDAEVVSLEMKVGAKCNVSQVLKYALLGLAVELRFCETRRHHLALLGVGDFSNQWQERFASEAELRFAITDTDLGAFLSTRPVRFHGHERRFGEIVASLDVAFINYPALAAFLRGASPPNSDQSAGAEVYRKLIAGMLGELSRRQLAT